MCKFFCSFFFFFTVECKVRKLPQPHLAILMLYKKLKVTCCDDAYIKREGFGGWSWKLKQHPQQSVSIFLKVYVCYICMTGVETDSLLCHIHIQSPPGWAFPSLTLTRDDSLHGGRVGDHLVRQKTVWITNLLPQHHLPNRITQHNKRHKIIKLITTLNPCLIHSAQLTCAGILCQSSHKREQSYKTGEHRTAACDALILALIGFVNYVAKLTLSLAR